MSKLLYIDDVEMNLFTLQSVIESHTNHKVLLASSAKEGLKFLLKEQDIELVYLDVMMPEIDGFECARMIRQNKKTKDIPIIFITAKTDDETIEECYASGGSDYMSKPFKPVELLARTTLHLELSRERQEVLQEKEFIQNIIDLQDEMISVCEEGKIVYKNHSFELFFKEEEFVELFEKQEHYFHPSMAPDPKEWMEYAYELGGQKAVYVKVLKSKEEYIFSLDIKKFKTKYMIVFADITKISQKTQKFAEEANVDSLTKIYNRNKFNKVMQKKFSDGDDFSLIMFDIDHFKHVNDTFGHQVGDETLISLAAIIKEGIRSRDFFARWGGEEFVIVVDACIDNTALLAQKLRERVEQSSFKTVEHITCSFGVTAYKQDDTRESIMQRTDKALYRAKQEGRNKVCTA